MEQNKSLPHTTLPHIIEWLKGSTMYSWNVPGDFFTQVRFPNFAGEKQSNTQSGLKNRTETCTLPNSKTPYEMLYSNKPNLAVLREWGMKVWVHDASGMKLVGKSRI